jgi:hypothetical protein
MKVSTLLLCCFIVLTLVAAPYAQAQPSSLDCRYLIAGKTFAFTFGGYLDFSALGSLYPNSGAGVVTFLPNGKVKGKLSLFVGADIVRVVDAPFTSDSSYSVHWETSQKTAVCRGTASLNIQDIAGDFMILVTNFGNRIEMIHNDLGITLTSTAWPMETDHCNNSSLQGSYSYNAKGWMLPPPPFPPVNPAQTLSGFIPFAFSGVITFVPGQEPENPVAPKHSALLKGWDYVIVDGAPSPMDMNRPAILRTYTGWYKVNPDCTATMTLEDSIGNQGQYAITTENYILRGGGLYVLNTNPGTALVFTSWKVQ